MSDNEKEIRMIEESRSRMHRIIDQKYDALINDIQNGRTSFKSRKFPLTSNPSVFKGEKPASITMSDGQMIPTPSWKSVATAILKDCNADTKRHELMLKLCGVTAGRFRPILSHDPSEMNVPLEIDDDLYFEGKFDTEYLIKMMTEKVLDQVGYDYSGITVTLRNEMPAPTFESEEDTPTEDEAEGFSMQMM